jgi:Spy/CpxP family protein refolding chaperone
MTNRWLLTAVLIVSAGMAAAQPLPPGKWWQRPEVIQKLGLTAEQQQKLDEVFRAAADELIDARADVEKAQVALRGELERPQLRRNDVRAIAARLSDARAKLFERELMMLVDMRGVLNDTQWQRMRKQLDRMEERRPGQQGGRRPPG